MLTVRVVTLVSSRLVTVWVTTQKCASLNSLTTTKTWLRKKWLRKLPVPVVQRRALLPKLLPLLKLHRLLKLLLLKKQKQNNSTILFIYRKPSQRLGRLFCLRFYHFTVSTNRSTYFKGYGCVAILPLQYCNSCNLSIYDKARFFRDSIKRILAILFLHEQTLKDVCIKQTCEINRYICTQLWADI